MILASQDIIKLKVFYPIIYTTDGIITDPTFEKIEMPT